MLTLSQYTCVSIIDIDNRS